ncbi:MAG: hypothetical protein JSR33_09650, partial [Proteobacteria bacterium]|nr:hypothetical protein [Pseudomonadota bacterium]
MKLIILGEEKDCFTDYLTYYNETRHVLVNQAENFERHYGVAQALHFLIPEWNYYSRAYQEAQSEEKRAATIKACEEYFQIQFKKINENFGTSIEIATPLDDLLKACIKYHESILLNILYDLKIKSKFENLIVPKKREKFVTYQSSIILDQNNTSNVKRKAIEALEKLDTSRWKKIRPSSSKPKTVLSERPTEIKEKKLGEFNQSPPRTNEPEISAEESRRLQEESVRRQIQKEKEEQERITRRNLEAEKEKQQQEEIKKLKNELISTNKKIEELNVIITKNRENIYQKIAEYEKTYQLVEDTNSEVIRYSAARENARNSYYQVNTLVIDKILLPENLPKKIEKTTYSTYNPNSNITSTTNEAIIKELATELAKSKAQQQELEKTISNQNDHIATYSANLEDLEHVLVQEDLEVKTEPKNKVAETNKKLQAESQKLYEQLANQIQQQVTEGETAKEQRNNEYLTFRKASLCHELNGFKIKIQQKTQLLNPLCSELDRLSLNIESGSIQVPELEQKLAFAISILPIYGFNPNELEAFINHRNRIRQYVTVCKKYEQTIDKYKSEIDLDITELKNQLHFYNPSQMDSDNFRKAVKEALESLFSILFTCSDEQITDKYLERILWFVQNGLNYFEHLEIKNDDEKAISLNSIKRFAGN